MMLLTVLAVFLLTAGIIAVILPIHIVMTGIVLILLGMAVLFCRLLHSKANEKLSFLRELVSACAAAALILLITCMGLITAGADGNPAAAAQSDYAIVLGAAVREDGTASRIMRERLRAAIDFMESNPKAVLILSGGQGGDEPETEAVCMYETLLTMGADPDRLLLEDQSHTTRENLINSRALIESRGGTGKTITLITSDFHIRRALFLADKLGLDACGWSADTDLWFFRVNYILREVFAMVKAILQTALNS